MRLLLDENVPEGVRGRLPGHEVRTAKEMGWSGVTNGRLLGLAEGAGFDVLITGDLNIRYQNNMTGRPIAIVELSGTHLPTVRGNLPALREAVARATPGSHAVVTLPRPPLRRRPPPADLG